MNENNHVILIGYMGAGKSTVGIELARKLNREYIDLDTEIVLSEKKQIPDIFEELGEPYFRAAEAQVLRAVKGEKVISTGGGVLYFQDTGRWMKKNGTVIYLNAPFEELYERIAGDGNRPLVMNNTAASLEQVFYQRDIVYREAADLIVSVSECSVEYTLDEIIVKLTT